MQVRVLMLGPARDIAGVDAVTIELQELASLGDAVNQLFADYPRLAPSGDGAAPANGLRFAINRTFASMDTPLTAGDEIAVIPPVSGGTDGGTDNGPPRFIVRLMDEPLDATDALRLVSGDPEAGGIAVFIGTSRAEANADGTTLQSLFYEAYREMAVEQMESLIAAAAQRWPICRTALLHRVGEVPLAEASVVVAVACPHRGEAFEACRWLIDTLKEQVPIWKKDRWGDGSETWVDPGVN